MKKSFLSLIVSVSASLAVCAATAGDRGPQFVRASLPLGAGAITPVPVAGTGRFTPQFITFQTAAGETQTVSYAAMVSTNAAVTNACATLVVSATSHTLAITNIPPLFAGDKFVIVGSNTGTTNACVLVGTLFD